MAKLHTNSNAHPLNTRISGHGPTVVLLHGFLASSEYWERTRALLAKEHTVVAIDLLGFGNSPKPYCSNYDYEAHISSIELTLNSLKIKKPFTLIGHSMGSLLAMRYANTYPERVSKLLLTNMPIMLNSKEVTKEIYSSKIVRLGLHPTMQYFIWGLFKLIAKLRLMPREVKQILNGRSNYIFQHTGVSRVKSFRNVIVNGTVEEDLNKLPMQATILNGLLDRKIYMDNLSKMTLPASVSLKNINSTHHIPILMPEIVSDLLSKP